MDAMHLLHTRYSALKLDEPAPSPEAVRAMLESAARVPDHGRLLPWRIILVEGDARLRLGEVLAEGTPDEIRADPRVREAYLGRRVA